MAADSGTSFHGLCLAVVRAAKSAGHDYGGGQPPAGNEARGILDHEQITVDWRGGRQPLWSFRLSKSKLSVRQWTFACSRPLDSFICRLFAGIARITRNLDIEPAAANSRIRLRGKMRLK